MSAACFPVRRLLTGGAVAIALVAACTDTQGPTAYPPSAPLPFVAAFTDYPSVTQVVLTVTGPRIDPPLVFNIPVVNDTARGTMELPVGNNRTILAQAFDSVGAEVLRGQRTVSVAAGANPSVALVLLPLTGSVPVTAAIGNVTLTLSAASATVRAGGTVALTAEVRDATGDVLIVPVLFAVSRPPAARVQDNGTLVALDTGSVTVTATAFGRSASTLLQLTPGTVLEGLAVLPDSVLGSGSVEAVVSVRDPGGVDSLRLQTVSPTGAAGPACSATAPLRGSRSLGDFSCELVLPVGAAAGRWPVSRVELFANPNVAVLDSISLRHRGAAAVVRIVP